MTDAGPRRVSGVALCRSGPLKTDQPRQNVQESDRVH